MNIFFPVNYFFCWWKFLIIYNSDYLLTKQYWIFNPALAGQ